ncbi:MAG UNVERIFIED_CONTAM: virulence RhuM family protein [Planctomycetaceae bacterium]
MRLLHETIWLPQRLIADLFHVSVKTANEHLINIYNERELDPAAAIRKFRIVQIEGNCEVSRTVDHYNLDAILAVGYRVRSHRGTQFRIWATERLREYLIKGFAMDDVRLKRAGAGNFFRRQTDATDTRGSAVAAATVNPAPAPNPSAHATTAPTRSWTTSSGEIWKPKNTGFEATDPDRNGFVGRLRSFRWLIKQNAPAARVPQTDSHAWWRWAILRSSIALSDHVNFSRA